jgi:peroxiredoxin
MKKGIRWVWLMTTVTLAALSNVSCRPSDRATGDGVSALSGKTAANFELKGLDGRPVRLSDFKGKVVLLDFWATWCPPCRMEIPGFVELQKRHAAQGFTVLGVALDQDGASVVKPFADKIGINYPLAIGNADIAGTYGGIESIPTTFLIDRKGTILQTYVGAHDAETFERDVQAALR